MVIKYGTNGSDILTGGASNDVIYAYDGNDIIQFTPWTDTIYGGGGVDLMDFAYATSGLTVTKIGATALKAVTANGAVSYLYDMENIYATSYKDYVQGTDGANHILLFDSNDTAGGGLGNDTVEGHWGHDSLGGGEGEDLLVGGQNNDSLFGGNGNDVLYGNWNAAPWSYDQKDDVDYLDGGGGNDRLYGEYSNDVIYGGTGKDTLNGGFGNDRFVFNVGDSGKSANGTQDVIEDFQSGYDKIDLSSLPGTAFFSGMNSSYAFVDTPGVDGVEVMWVPFATYGGYGIGANVRVDVNGDNIADFTIDVLGAGNGVAAGDFIL